MPKLLILEKCLPFWVFQWVQRMVSNLLFCLFLNLNCFLSILNRKIFFFLLSDNDFKHVILDELVIMYKFTLHQGDPFVFGGRQVFNYYFPKESSDWIKLKNYPVTKGGEVLNYVIFIHAFIYFIYTFRVICFFVNKYTLACFVE